MPERNSDELVLADRLVNYADAITALAFVGVSGFGAVMADPDVRCSIAQGADELFIGNLASALLFTSLILMLRRWEGVLRADSPPPPSVARYAKMLHGVRIGIVWISFGLLWALGNAASGLECETPPRSPSVAAVCEPVADPIVRPTGEPT